MRDILQQTTQDFSSLIGIPYEEKNCWDLVVSFYSTILKIELKHYYDGPTPHRDVTKNLIYSNVGEFEKVTSPSFGDIILIKLYGVESHIGVYVENGRMLHSIRGRGSVIELLDRWKTTIVGYYRIKK